VSFASGAEGLLEALGVSRIADLPPIMQRIIEGIGGVVASAAMTPERYWEQVHDRLAKLTEIPLHAFAGMSDDDIQDCVARSNILDCANRDRLLKKEGSSHNLFHRVREASLEHGENALRAPDPSREPADHLTAWIVTQRRLGNSGCPRDAH
jgi:hypothetical protein